MALCPPVWPSSGTWIVVWKSLFSLGLYQDGMLASREDGDACVDVALGGAPVGDKEQQGDERTPEGTFRVTHKNPRSAYTLSLGLSYPDAVHARRAFADGRISAPTRDRIVAADHPGGMPDRGTSLGGDIYIHGGGSAPRDWTDGCIGLADADVRWLYDAVRPGVAVLILP